MVSLFSSFLALIHYLSQSGVVLPSFFAILSCYFAFGSVELVLGYFFVVCLCEVVIVLD